MRETNFINQKKAQWQKFETILNAKGKKNPEELSELFVQITDDLSYARTFYPNRSVRVYLNGLAQKVFYSIYKNKKIGTNKFWTFWKEEVPDLVWHSRKIFLLSFAIFFIAFLIGWISAEVDPNFHSVILGKEYIKTTEANIAKGDPLGVYKDPDAVSMFLRIASNNLRVDFMTFGFGLLFGIGAIGIMLHNGILFATFQHFFYFKGLFITSFFTIWVHGTFELFTVIFSGAAGIILGTGLAFPGTYTRLQAFQISARKGIKLMIATCALTIMAAFNESFLTRFTDIPIAIRGLIMLASLGFVLTYFVWYPYRRHKAGLTRPETAPVLPPTNQEPLQLHIIKTNGEILQDTFSLIRDRIAPYIWLSMPIAALYTLGLYLLKGGDISSILKFRNWTMWLPATWFDHIENITQYLWYKNLPPAIIAINGVVFTVVSLLINYQLVQLYAPEKNRSFLKFALHKANFLKTGFIIALLSASLFVGDNDSNVLFFFLCLPFLHFWLFVSQIENINLATALSRTFKLLSGNFMQLVIYYVMVLVVWLLFSFLTGSNIILYYYQIIQLNFPLAETDAKLFLHLLMTWMNFLLLLLLTPLLTVGLGLLYGSFRESNDASTLKEAITQIGISRNIRGIIRE